MAVKVNGSGPKPARIMIVAEAPASEEERQRMPLVGASGQELDRMLHDAGIARSECYVTNVCKYRAYKNDMRYHFHDGFTKSGKGTGTMRLPNDLVKEGLRELHREIEEVRPNIIVAFGNTSLWALQNRPSAKSGIADWRGSELMLPTHLPFVEEPLTHECVVVPTYHPAGVLRNWEWRAEVVHDLRVRVKKYLDCPRVEMPPYRFIIRPIYEQVRETLEAILRRLNESSDTLRLAVDIETRHRHISCIGIGWSQFDAICIPFTCIERPAGYWSPEEEASILLLLQEVLTHENARCVGQNFLYDAQYFARYLGFVPRVRDDTMLAQHVAYAGMSKGLDFLSSLYCRFHRFWKHEGKDFGNYKTADEQDEGWTYNAKDCVITYECADTLDTIIDKLGLRAQYAFQMELWHHVLHMMLRGVLLDKKLQAKLGGELMEAQMARQALLEYICGHPLNPASPKQMHTFFYHDLGLPEQFKRGAKNADGTRKVTLDEEALEALVRKEPLLTPVVQPILELRSLGIAYNVSQTTTDPDGRGRSYFNPGGAETYRWTSSESAFRTGTNFQNLSRGQEDDEEGIDPSELKQYELPNIRKIFIPDTGYTIGEVDQAGADAQVVAWEADDSLLKELFRKRLKLHVENGKMMYPELMRGNPKREPYYTRVKAGCHATNYGAKPRTLSGALGITMHEAEMFQRRWFQIHPAILEWHKRIDRQLMETRQVQNKFGYRRFYFDRVEELLPEALAWVPQSTVAHLSNFAIVNTRPLFTLQATFAEHLQNVHLQRLRKLLYALGYETLIQVHDSIVFQYPTKNEALILPLLQQAITTIVPYHDPLVIPWGLKTSTRSWGDAEEREWPEPLTLEAIQVAEARYIVP